MSRGTVVDSDLEQWDAVQQINVRSMVLTARAAVPAMAASGGGAIVNVSSIAALRPRGMTAYSTSKATAIALSQSMAVDHAVDGTSGQLHRTGAGLHAHGLCARDAGLPAQCPP